MFSKIRDLSLWEVVFYLFVFIIATAVLYSFIGYSRILTTVIFALLFVLALYVFLKEEKQ